MWHSSEIPYPKKYKDLCPRMLTEAFITRRKTKTQSCLCVSTQIESAGGAATRGNRDATNSKRRVLDSTAQALRGSVNY